MKTNLTAIYRDEDRLLARVKLAGNFWSRCRGLMFYRRWPDFDGLLLYPCRSIHMFWMWFPLDILFLNRERRVIHIEKKIRPNRIGPTLRDAFYVLEIPAGKASELQLAVGHIIDWEQKHSCSDSNPVVS